MKKLNNKGITTIEVLICFVLVVIITVSMYGTVSSFNEKRIMEGYKEELSSYINLLTKEMQDDFIKIGLTHVKYDRTTTADGKVTYTVTCDLKDGTRRKLIVDQTLGKSTYHIGGTETVDDEFLIRYGETSEEPNDVSKLIKYPIPDFGSSKNPYNHTIKDLSINNVIINVIDDSVLSIYIGFYHPELMTRYAISIVCPINYTINTESTPLI